MAGYIISVGSFQRISDTKFKLLVTWVDDIGNQSDEEYHEVEGETSEQVLASLASSAREYASRQSVNNNVDLETGIEVTV